MVLFQYQKTRAEGARKFLVLSCSKLVAVNSCSNYLLRAALPCVPDTENQVCAALAGNRPQQWVAELLADADVILATIVGRALVESALSSTPIVAYDCEWHAEFITEGATGLLVPLGDTAAMGEGALALLSDSSRAAKIGSGARTHALEVMSPTVVTQLEREFLVTRFPMLQNSEQNR